MEWRCDSFMTNEKITAMPVKKKQIPLTATLNLPQRLHERAWPLPCSRSLSTSLVQHNLEVPQNGDVLAPANTVSSWT